MVRSRNRFLIALAVLLASCEQNAASPHKSLPTTTLTLRDTLAADSILYTVGDSETTRGQTLYRVRDAVLIPDGLLVATEGAQGILQYDSDGRFINLQGGPGEGPGEYRRIRSLHSDGGRGAAWDPATQRVTFLPTENGAPHTVSLSRLPLLLSRREMMPLEVEVLATGNIVAAYFGRQLQTEGVTRRLVLLALYDSSGQFVSDWGIVEGAEHVYSQDGGGIAAPFGHRFFTGASGDAFFIGTGRDSELVQYSWDKGPVRVLKLPTARRPLSRSEWSEWRESFLESRIPAPNRADVRRLLDSGLTADSFPAYTEVKSGSSGLLWLEAYGGAEEPRSWLLIDHHNNSAELVQLPAGAEVLDGTRTQVAVLMTDELDREYVRVYRLTRTN